MSSHLSWCAARKPRQNEQDRPTLLQVLIQYHWGFVPLCQSCDDAIENLSPNSDAFTRQRRVQVPIKNIHGPHWNAVWSILVCSCLVMCSAGLEFLVMFSEVQDCAFDFGWPLSSHNLVRVQLLLVVLAGTNTIGCRILFIQFNFQNECCAQTKIRIKTKGTHEVVVMHNATGRKESDWVWVKFWKIICNTLQAVFGARQFLIPYATQRLWDCELGDCELGNENNEKLCFLSWIMKQSVEFQK